MMMFNGLHMNLGNLSMLSNAQTRSISAENPTGGKSTGDMATVPSKSHAARGLGPGWKYASCIAIQARQTVTIAEIEGSGAIQHIWITTYPEVWRKLIIRFYWDDESTPSVEVPLGDFFCNGWGIGCNVASLPVAVNPSGGFNCYW